MVVGMSTLVVEEKEADTHLQELVLDHAAAANQCTAEIVSATLQHSGLESMIASQTSLG